MNVSQTKQDMVIFILASNGSTYQGNHRHMLPVPDENGDKREEEVLQEKHTPATQTDQNATSTSNSARFP